MKIAIIGAGFSGLAVAWHLLHVSNSITVFDSHGIGGGASGIAAGLLHPYAGAHAKYNWKGQEGLKATQELIHAAEKNLGFPVAFASGLLRIAMTPEQEKDFFYCSQHYADVSWKTADDCQKLVPILEKKHPGILISSAMTVNTQQYLEGLWKACEAKGAQFSNTEISSVSELDHFDAIVIAAGISCKKFPGLQSLPLTAVKGQILELEWPAEIPPLPLPLNSHAYVIMGPDNRSCYVGATYERDFASSDPDPKVAIEDLLPKASAMLPFLKNAPIIGCRAGIRVSTPDHLPICKQMNEKCWVLTGMGSKGLLYHALFAKQLTSEQNPCP